MMTQNREKLVTFAHPMTISIGMETIILSYEPGSDFAKKLDELIRNSEGVRVVRRKSKEERMKDVEKALNAKERKAAYRLAESVKKSIEEVNDAAKNGDHVGRDADEFLIEIMEAQS